MLLFSETGTDAADIVFAEISEEQLRLFGYDDALNVHYTILDYNPCSE